MIILRKIWFWTFVIGMLIGLYLGYQVGTIRGYERAIQMIQTVIDK